MDTAFIVAGIALLLVLTTRYQMSFRLDDVLHIEWARAHSFLGAWDPVHGDIVRSFRPIFAATIWILSHTAGAGNFFLWHATLVGSFLIGLAYAGRTSRYISGSASALYFSVALYLIAFLSILNVLFWFADLTFTIEMLFVTPAWYYGLRGLLEGRLWSFLVGTFSGILAVMGKEPAMILVHGVLLGALVLRWQEVSGTWRALTNRDRYWAIAAYFVFIGITAFVFFASPTKSNRFIPIEMHSSAFWESVHERSLYYASILLAQSTRLLVFFPIVYVGLDSLLDRILAWKVTIARVSLALLISLLLLISPLAGSLAGICLILILSLSLTAISNPTRQRAALLLLPFGICIAVICFALTLTTMIVKTQLTELAVTSLVISGWGWSVLLSDVSTIFKPLMQMQWVRNIAWLVLVMMVGGVTAALYPKISRQERLLCDVRDVRININDAIKWSAASLPERSTILLPDYHLHGISSIDELSEKDDSTKIHSQYVFHNGYVFTYLTLLDRPDIQHVYLEDSTTAGLELDSARHQSRSYLIIQSELDYEKFHGLFGKTPLLHASDSLLRSFNAGGFHSEVWRLG